MIPVNLKLSNFTSYGERQQALDFTHFKLAAISGLNGAGKSSLLDSITWCVWGTSRAGDSSDELIHQGADKMYVEFSFEFDGGKYTVKRMRIKKGGGSTSLELWSGGHNLTEGTIKATQEKIINLLHLTFETFTNSAFLRQDHADEFTTKGPTDRKRILSDILGLSHYDDLEEKAKEKIKDIQTKLQLLEYQVLEIETELSQKEEKEKQLAQSKSKVKEVENIIKILEGEITILKSRKEIGQILQSQKKELEQIIFQGKLRAERIKNLQNNILKLEDLQKEIDQFKKSREELEDLRKKQTEILNVQKQMASYEGQLNLKNHQKRTLEKEIEDLEIEIKQLSASGAKCPTCSQEINKDQKHQVKESLQKKIKDKRVEISKISTTDEEESLKKLTAFLKTIAIDEKKLKELQDSVTKLEDLQRQKEQALQNQAALETEKKTREELLILYKNKETQIKKLADDLGKLPEVAGELEEKEKELEAKKAEEKEARNLLGQATELISRSEQLEKLYKQKQEEKLTQQKESNIYAELALAFGKKGIQAMIIENAIPEIEDEANKLLDKLTEGRMKISLLTQRETKTKLADGEKGIIETLDIIISDEMGERPYEMYSVDGNELVYIRQNGQIQSIPIQQLWSDEKPTGKQGEYQLQNADLEALCYVNGKSKWQKVDKILRHKSPDKILQIRCGPGNYTVKLTKNHSVYVMTPDGLQVRRTDQIKPGYYLLSPRIIPQKKQSDKLDLSTFISTEFKDKRTINHKPLNYDESFVWSRSDQRINRYIKVDQNWGKLMGIAVAEGSGQIFYTISAGSSYELANEALQLAANAFGTKKRALGFVSQENMLRYIQNAPGISSKSPKAQYRPMIGGRLVAHIIKNMVGNKASMKRVPDFIFNTSKEVRLAFLKGLIIGDGYIRDDINSSKSEIGITTVSLRLAGELIFLCRQLGIWARLEKHGDEGFKRGMNHQKSYRVAISGKKNLEILGLGKIVSNYGTATKYEGIPYDLVDVSRINSKRFPRGVENQIFNCGVHCIPKSAQENYQRIQSLTDEWNILEVKEIQEINSSSEYVYDLIVPGNNSFVAGNGAILVHNSGGEAFRVNFAIRLAISKLLTQRAGAKLQLLVIDEGFGSQDALGRARLVEVIDTIKDDFEKILVITHLEELKEEFPVRIEVTKEASGSTFEVIGI